MGSRHKSQITSAEAILYRSSEAPQSPRVTTSPQWVRCQTPLDGSWIKVWMLCLTVLVRFFLLLIRSSFFTNLVAVMFCVLFFMSSFFRIFFTPRWWIFTSQFPVAIIKKIILKAVNDSSYLLDISALVSNHQINSDKINDRGRQTINKLGRIYILER